MLFSKSRSVVTRRVYLPKVAAADIVKVPAGAANVKVFAQNKTGTAVSISAGNSVGGAQFCAVTPVGTGTVAAPAVIRPAQAGPTIVYAADGDLHVTATVGGVADVVIEYTEMLKSLPLMVGGSYANGQQGDSAQ